MPPRNPVLEPRSPANLQEVVSSSLHKALGQVTATFRFVSGSTILFTAAFTFSGTFAYVAYRDWRRDRVMMERFSKGIHTDKFYMSLFCFPGAYLGGGGAGADTGFFLGARPPPLRLSAIFFLYSNPQMLICPCPKFHCRIQST